MQRLSRTSCPRHLLRLLCGSSRCYLLSISPVLTAPSLTRLPCPPPGLFATKPSVNVLSRCDKETLKGVRKLMLEVVLHTDMSKHFSMVSKAELFAELHMGTIAMAARGDANAAQRLWTKGEDRTFAMALLLHAADISNPAKPLEIQEKWAHKVMQEFFRQGDREAELGLPISPGFDRKTASLPSSQLNFIEFGAEELWRWGVAGQSVRQASRIRSFAVFAAQSLVVLYAVTVWKSSHVFLSLATVVMPLYASVIGIFPVRIRYSPSGGSLGFPRQNVKQRKNSESEGDGERGWLMHPPSGALRSVRVRILRRQQLSSARPHSPPATRIPRRS